MNAPPRPQYAIVSDRDTVVTTGAVVTYRLVRRNVSEPTLRDGRGRVDPIELIYPQGHPYRQAGVMTPRTEWHVQQDPATTRRTIIDGPEGFQYKWAITWDDVGEHELVCLVGVPPPWNQGNPLSFEIVRFVQRVIPLERRLTEIGERVTTESWARWFGSVHDDTRDTMFEIADKPERYAARVAQLLKTYEAMEAALPTPPDKTAAFARKLASQREYLDALLRITWRDHGTDRTPLVARHFAAETQTETPLLIYLSLQAIPRTTKFHGVDDHSKSPNDRVWIHRWTIVDWTQPTLPSGHGTWHGVDIDPNAALAEAFRQWRNWNRYPAGTMVLAMPSWIESGIEATGTKPVLRFETTGARFVDHITTWMDRTALVSALVGVVGLAVLPVPGGRVAAGLLWASMMAGSAAATIRIVSRHADENAKARFIDDGIDLLQIVSNLVGTPAVGTVWKRGATVTFRDAAAVGLKDPRAAFLGQIMADGAQGVLMGVDAIDQVMKAVNDPSLDPIERVERTWQLLTELVLGSGLLLISISANVRDLARVPGGMNNPQLRARLEALGNEGESIDLKKPPSAKGHTTDDPYRVTIDVDPPAAPPLVAKRPQLSDEAETILAGATDAQRAQANKMVDFDAPSTDALLKRFGLDALDHADAFVEVWERRRTLDLSPAMMRTYHEHTGLSGIDYLAGRHKTKPPITDEEFIAGLWVVTREADFAAKFGHAGHSAARHGPHLTDEELDHRIKTGVAADGQRSHTRTSTRFRSWKDWLDAHDTAEKAFKARYGLGRHQGPYVAPDGKKWCRITGVIDMVQAIGEGFVGRPTTKSLLDNKKNQPLWSATDPIPSSDMTSGKVQVAFGWTGSEWVYVQDFPVVNNVGPAWKLYQEGDQIK